MIFKTGIWSYVPRREVSDRRTEIKKCEQNLLPPVSNHSMFWSVGQFASSRWFLSIDAMALLSILSDPQFCHFLVLVF